MAAQNKQHSGTAEPVSMAGLKAEATGRPTVTFTYDSDSYTASTEFNLDVLEAWELRQYTVAMRRLLGEQQWRTFRERHSSQDDLLAFMDAYGEAQGVKNS